MAGARRTYSHYERVVKVTLSKRGRPRHEYETLPHSGDGGAVAWTRHGAEQHLVGRVTAQPGRLDDPVTREPVLESRLE